MLVGFPEDALDHRVLRERHVRHIGDAARERAREQSVEQDPHVSHILDLSAGPTHDATDQ